MPRGGDPGQIAEVTQALLREVTQALSQEVTQATSWAVTPLCAGRAASALETQRVFSPPERECRRIHPGGSGSHLGQGDSFYEMNNTAAGSCREVAEVSTQITLEHCVWTVTTGCRTSNSHTILYPV